MKELVVEVDDLGGDQNEGSHYRSKHKRDDQPSVHQGKSRSSSALGFFRAKGYEVVFSDPESRQYDEASGELTGESQCRRDVMRKELGGNDESGGYTFHKTTNVSQPEGTSSSIPTGRKGESLSVSIVVDVEYSATEFDSEASLLSKTRTDETPLE